MKKIITFLLFCLVVIICKSQGIPDDPFLPWAEVININNTSGSIVIKGTDYANNMNRRYHINVGMGRILVSGTVKSENQDVLKIYETDPSFNSAIYMESFSGSESFSYISESNEGVLIIEIITNSSLAGEVFEGFVISYEKYEGSAQLFPEHVTISSNLNKPNLMVRNTTFRSLGNVANREVDYNNALVMLENGINQQKLAMTTNKIHSNNYLSFASSYAMYFNSNGGYTFTSPVSTNTKPFEITSDGKININSPLSSNTDYRLNMKIKGEQWEGFTGFWDDSKEYGMTLGNGGSNIGGDWFGSLSSHTKDKGNALYIFGNNKYDGERLDRGIIIIDGRRNSTKATGTEKVIDFWSGWGNRLAHIDAEGTFVAKTNVEAKGNIIANDTIKGQAASVQKLMAHNARIVADLEVSKLIAVETQVEVANVEVLNAIELKVNNQLEAKGGILTTEVLVKNIEEWPDYVFSDDYQLKTLSEVESFINANHHLPEIPSAVDIKEAGVNLAEMNKLLLKKVEELTLYSIELEKEVKRQDLLRQSVEAEVEKVESLELKVVELSEEKRVMSEELEERLAKLEALLTK